MNHRHCYTKSTPAVARRRPTHLASATRSWITARSVRPWGGYEPAILIALSPTLSELSLLIDLVIRQLAAQGEERLIVFAATVIGDHQRDRGAQRSGAQLGQLVAQVEGLIVAVIDVQHQGLQALLLQDDWRCVANTDSWSLMLFLLKG